LSCIGELFHSTLTHLSGQKPICKHKRKRKKPQSSIDFGRSKQVVRNLVGSIKDELNCIGELLHSTLTHWSGQKFTWKHNLTKKTLQFHELWIFKTSGQKFS
jgi:hypothetical protein